MEKLVMDTAQGGTLKAEVPEWKVRHTESMPRGTKQEEDCALGKHMIRVCAVSGFRKYFWNDPDFDADTTVDEDAKSGSDDSKSSSAEAATESESTRSGSFSPSSGTDSPPASPLDRCGSGWGGAWLPADDFAQRRRKTKWVSPRSAVPPRLYLDHCTLIREATDVCTLRRGDHCLIAINLVPHLSTTIDYIISLLGSLELCWFYHHFLIIDDVDYVDEGGVPRTKIGRPVEVVEYGNTIPEVLQELRLSSGGHLLGMPRALLNMFAAGAMTKARKLPLSDYGDTRHFYVVVEHLTPDERETIANKAVRFLAQPEKYNLISNNCEHIANEIKKGRPSSPQVTFAVVNISRLVVCCIGLFFLNMPGITCYSSYCTRYPFWAMAAYHLFTSAPVGLEAVIQCILIIHNVSRQHLQATIDRHDYVHLVLKELGRAFFTGLISIAAISKMPSMICDTQYCATASVICIWAYMASDLLFNVSAHAVMRLVLLPLYGRVWFTPPDTAKKEL
eukprot:gnl/TRDRNA2_/TRDRNA2_83972_c0_seq1.p1 gnl/TRDRNA2_/TRDRNA2_83972_c0~~gnl/TRDRNA2_/TRDRNA2_83972_c0_seq1.p1  ORF type:complete len:514 (+),score=72.42 gnl/TRDRNA2_/TRDRNA2_83972_c0_seq1:29-1543(+)